MMRLRRIRTKTLIAALVVGISGMVTGCDSPTAFERNNVRDPQSDRFAPETPDGLKAIADGNKVILSWTDGSVFEDGYLIERSIDGASDFVEVARLERGASQFEDAYVKPALKLWYRVSSFREAGDELQIEPGETVVIDLYPDFGRPPEITLVTEKRMDISWQDVLDFEIGYELQRAVQSDSFVTIGIYPANQTHASDESLFHVGTRYRYRVRPLYDGGDAPFSEAAVRRISGFEYAPPTVTLHVDDEADVVTVKWNRMSKAAGYVVERAPGESETFDTIAELPQEASSYEDELDREVGRYRYRVRTMLSGPSFAPSIAYGRVLKERMRTSALSTSRVAFAPGGRLLISQRTAIQVWDTEARTLERTVPIGGGFNSLAVHPQYPWVAATTGSGLFVYDYETLATVFEQALPSARKLPVAFSGDGTLLATLSETGDIEVLSVGDWSVRWSHPQPSDQLLAEFVFAPDGSYLVASYYDQMHLFDTHSGKWVRELKGFLNPHAFSPDGSFLAANGRTSTIYRMPQGTVYWEGLRGGWLASIGFGLNSREVYTADDYALMIWDVEQKSEVLTHYEASAITAVTLNRETQMYATVHTDGSVVAWMDGDFWTASW